jgi:8-oxo-dGTP pyrophosphatase MutT (NUDIX family)
VSDHDSTNPWRILGSREVYENPWIRVREDQVLRPDGAPGIYGVVHFKSRAIGVLPVDDSGRIWMIGQYRYPIERYSWEIPEGGGHEGETTEESARRELREETGLSAHRLELLAISHLSNSVSDEVAYIYRATGLTEGPSQPEGTEKLQVRRMEWDEIWAMFARGELTDSMTLIAILHESLRRGSRPPTLGPLTTDGA